MINKIKSTLGIKLFLTYLAVILVGGIVLFSTTQFALPTAFNRHMGGMMGFPLGAMGMGGNGAGQGQGYGIGQSLYNDFRAGFNDALVWAILTAGGLALVVSILFSRSVVAPLRAMMHASQRIAAGHYDERVQTDARDELGQLAVRFNQMAENLQQVETMRRQLIGDVTHELRTPLTAIKGSMEGLMDGILPPTGETFEQIHQEADRLSRLVDDLQELSRVESQALKLKLAPVEVTDLINTSVKRLARQFEEKGVALTSSQPKPLPLIQVDADRIGQVLINLLGNALQNTPEGGSANISAEQINGEISFSVKDTGIGIPSEHLPHIFDRFYRVDKSRSRRSGGGSGIGLTIAKSLVEAHGGNIRVTSEGDGKGSTFIFTIPIRNSVL